MAIRISRPGDGKEFLTKEIQKAMIDCDIGYDQLGGDAKGSGWRARINNPHRMTVGALIYLSSRLHINWPELVEQEAEKRRHKR